MPQFPDFCCPQCKGSLNFTGKEYSCPQCAKKYPVVLGIPDFRVFPDSYISYEDDYQKARFLIEKAEADNLDFKGLVRLYWSITPEVSEDRAERFMKRTFALVEKGVENLKEIETLSRRKDQTGFNAVLEIGCGTGGFLVAAKEKFKHVIGIDIAFRWLIIAKKRLDELNLDVPLICACAEALPFKEETFDLIVAENVLEHVRGQEDMLKECRRLLNSDGVLFLTTPNRFGLTPEPHVRVWGVGFLPRKWMGRYVKLIKGIPYRHLKVLSFPEINKLLKKVSFQNYRILFPSLPQEELKNFSALEKFQVAMYEALRKTPFIRSCLYILGPSFHILCYANKNPDSRGS